MDLDALRHANFKLLDDAITDWSTLVRHLNDLKTDAENGLVKMAAKADWEGVNAKTSREFIDKTAKEFSDAHTQATTIHNILRDTCDELKNYRTQLLQAIDRGEKKGMKVVSGKGTFEVSARDSSSDHDTAEDKPTQADIDALRDEIQRIIDKATESDTSAKTVLQAISDQSKLGFTDASYKDRDAAVDVMKRADELAKLARKKPEDLTVSDFDKLNAGLKKYAGDELFAEEFAKQLGPQKTLEFWAGINDRSRSNWDLERQRADQFADLQRNLSLTLANATQSDSPAMAEWKRHMIDIGDKYLYGNRGGPMGFQVMSNLMRTGDYDDQFLEDYGTKLMETERKLTDNGRHGNMAWQHLGVSPWLNRIGEDSGSDPLTGYLKGLSNSPAAATEFFNQQYISKDDPDNPFERDTDGNGKKGKVSLSNFQYLFEEREWPKESDSHGDEVITGKNNLALALEAAATGHPAGEMPTADTPPHNAAQAKLVESIIHSVSEDPSRLTKSSYMSDSMGQIAAEYMPDINRALHAGTTKAKDLYLVAGSPAVLGDEDVTRFLYTVARNPEGYTAINLGQHSYTTSLMQYHFKHPDAYVVDPHYPQAESLKDGITDIAQAAGKVEGIIGAARAYENEVQGAEADAKYNAAIDAAGTWGGTVVGIGIGMATEPLPGPAGSLAGDLLGTAADEIISSITEGAKKDSTDQIVYRNGADWQDTKSSTYIMVEEAARKAGKAADNRYPLIEASVARAAESGFNSARTNIRTYLEGEGIPRQLDTEGD
ncbi:hypothetical protein ACPCJU_25475 [Streptomyces thermodiastaticus]